MTITIHRTNDARALRKEILAAGLHCTIPRGEVRPRIWTTWGSIAFASRREWLKYVDLRKKFDVMSSVMNSPRSPLELMIDESCGITRDALAAIDTELRRMADRRHA